MPNNYVFNAEIIRSVSSCHIGSHDNDEVVDDWFELVVCWIKVEHNTGIRQRGLVAWCSENIIRSLVHCRSNTATNNQVETSYISSHLFQSSMNSLDLLKSHSARTLA